MADGNAAATVTETDLTHHLYFEAPQCITATHKAPSNMHPLVSNLQQWLDYWKARAAATTAKNAISKAQRHMAPRSYRHFMLVVGESEFIHSDQDDWDEFEEAVRGAFRQSKADLALHPLGHADWLRPIKLNQSSRLANNALLMAMMTITRKPIKHIGSLVFGKDNVVAAMPAATYRHMATFIQKTKILPEGRAFDLGANVTIANAPWNDHARLGFMCGVAFGAQIQAIMDFKHHCVPATVGEKLQDVLEKEWKTDGSLDFFRKFPKALDTLLTSLVNQQGKSLADNPASTQVMLLDGQNEAEMASAGYVHRTEEEKKAFIDAKKSKGKGKGKGKGKNNGNKNKNKNGQTNAVDQDEQEPKAKATEPKQKTWQELQKEANRAENQS